MANFGRSDIPEEVQTFEALAVWTFERLQRLTVGRPVPLAPFGSMVPVFSSEVIEGDDGRCYCRLEGFPPVDRHGLNAPNRKTWLNTRSVVGVTPDLSEEEPPPPPPGPDPVPLADLIYSQSTVYGANVAATAANMQDNDKDTGTGTGLTGPTSSQGPAQVTIDLGDVYVLDRVVLSAVGGNFPGGWGGLYISGGSLQISDDGQNWEVVGDPVTVPQFEQVVVPVDIETRWLRYGFPFQNAYLAMGEFYPLAPGQSLV